MVRRWYLVEVKQSDQMDMALERSGFREENGEI